MPELTPEELADLLAQLDDVCRQAREVQERIKAKMADQARRDYPSPDSPGVKRRRQKKRPDG